ncbi:hypothetical protein HDV06_003099 [Boothiomyces sp. JEL0866]|nr:hypothetical protein HDV06_003099 [Boothiomyces sp. JEL0866]
MQNHGTLGHQRTAVRGSDPITLVEKIIRERIFSSVYFKQKLFGATAEIMVDRGIDLLAIGGQYGLQRPTEFLCCTLKLLQLQPETEIIQLYIQDEFKYLTALGAFYLRLTGSSVDVYKSLEPLLLDKRKLRKRMPDGTYEITHMDEFIDELLTAERSCDIILPRLTKRYVLEDLGELEPRISPLEDELDGYEEPEPEIVEEEVNEEPKAEIPLEDIDPLHKKKKKFSNKKVKGLFKKEKKKEAQEEEEDKVDHGYEHTLSVAETNRIRASYGLSELK